MNRNGIVLIPKRTQKTRQIKSAMNVPWNELMMRDLYRSVRGNTDWIDEWYKIIQIRYISIANSTILGVNTMSGPPMISVKATEIQITAIAIMDSIISLMSSLYFLILW